MPHSAVILHHRICFIFVDMAGLISLNRKQGEVEEGFECAEN